MGSTITRSAEWVQMLPLTPSLVCHDERHTISVFEPSTGPFTLRSPTLSLLRPARKIVPVTRPAGGNSYLVIRLVESLRHPT